jgi:tetratricopeptide (TPR) repeat protein
MTNPAVGKLLLVGWDAADWQLIRPMMAGGFLPHLKRLVDEGAAGALASLQPALCPMLWTSVATGKRAYRHGIVGEVEPRADGNGVRAFGSTSRTSKAVWNILSQAGLRTNCIHWPASHPAEPINGVCVSNRFAMLPAAPGRAWPATINAVHPPSLGETLAQFRIRPEELDGSALLPFMPRAAEIDQATDKRLLACAMLLARASTVHAAATYVIENHPADFTAVLYDGIELFCRQFMQYHPPHLASTPAADFEMYRHVVTAAYAFHDMMLGRLLDLSGPQTTMMLVSDHGYEILNHRSSRAAMDSQDPAALHRPQGIWLMHGPQVKRGAEIFGASVLDVTPTILTFFGLPFGADMDGRPWAEAIDKGNSPLEIDRVLSWDKIEGDAGLPPTDARATAEATADATGDPESDEAIAHLLALGYTEPIDEAARAAANLAREQNQYLLARSLLEGGRAAAAAPLLEAIAGRHPSNIPYAEALFRAYLAQGRYRDARRVAETGIARGAQPALAHVALGALELAERKPARAIEHLTIAESFDADAPGIHVLIGQCYRRLRRWEDAQRAFERAAELDAGSEAAWHGLATVALVHDQNDRAAEFALRAIGLRANYAEAHYHLGVALVALDRAQDAAVALRRCLSIRPDMLAPYRLLAELYAGPLNDPAAAHAARRDAHAIILRRRAARQPCALPPQAGTAPDPSKPSFP